jgi:hypothetical protein
LKLKSGLESEEQNMSHVSQEREKLATTNGLNICGEAKVQLSPFLGWTDIMCNDLFYNFVGIM